MRFIALIFCLDLFAMQAVANQAHNTISNLSEQQRSALFSKMLTSEDAACATVSRTFFRGTDASDNAYWSVQCKSPKAYQIQISPNASGSTKVLDCAVAKALGINCFGKFK